ncbi:MAG: glycosyltransferase [Pseudomonadota bacterium]
MKIVDIAEFYAPHGGGVKTYIHQKLQAAEAGGHEAIILAPGPQTYKEPVPGGQIWWVKAAQLPFDKRYYLFTRSAEVHDILWQERPDVIEASSTWRGAWIAASWPGDALRALILHQEPVSVYPHTLLDGVLSPQRIDAVFLPFWRYMRQLQRRFDTTVVSGEWLAKRLARFGLSAPHVVPFGLLKQSLGPHFRDQSLRAKLLRDMGMDPDRAKLLINISRHHPEKRLKTVFEAVRLANHHRPIGLIQIGTGPSAKSIQRLARNTPFIHLQGFVSERRSLARYLASADAMIHAGAAETFGLVLAEGLCSGLPLIVPDRGGAFDMARPSHSEVYAAGNAEAAASAVMRLLDRDPGALQRSVSEAARMQLLPHDTHFQQLFSHYRDGLNCALDAPSVMQRSAA